MDLPMLFRATAALLLLAGVETLHGIARVRFLNRRVGDRRARQIGVATGSVLVLAVAALTTGWIGVETTAQALAVGAWWCAGMLAFDVGLGRWTFRLPWNRILREFDPRQGGFLALGMLVVLVAPTLVRLLDGWR
jgi:hypothetical protein